MLAWWDRPRKAVGIDRKNTSMDTQIAAQFKRFQIIQEVLNTEYLYVEDLKILVKHFLTPVRERQLLPSPEIPQIFLNVELILAFHADLLAKVRRQLHCVARNSFTDGTNVKPPADETAGR